MQYIDTALCIYLHRIMTPEELNRTIEFLIQHQARLSASQDRERDERAAFQTWAKNISGQLAANDLRMVELIEHQSRRLDENEEAHRRFEEL